MPIRHGKDHHGASRGLAKQPGVAAWLTLGRSGGRTRSGRGARINVRAGTVDDTRAIRPVAQFFTDGGQPGALVRDILSNTGQPTEIAPLLAAWQATTSRR